MSFGSKKPPKQDFYPRPKMKNKTEKKKTKNVRDLLGILTNSIRPNN